MAAVTAVAIVADLRHRGHVGDHVVWPAHGCEAVGQYLGG